jgi:glycosyltransferase involved in cell wall biosynthesis
MGKGGAEQVFKEIFSSFPQADIYALFNNMSSELQKEFLGDKKITVSFLQKFPFARKNHRYFFPFFKYAIESFDLSKYDLIISSSHAVAKGVKITDGQRHLCYCHTPVRYAWDMRTEYLEHVTNKGVRKIANWQLDKLKKWDHHSANRVTKFAANSVYVSKRIKNHYLRDAQVVYPPINTEFFIPNGITVKDRSQYIVVSRLVPYKRIDLIIRAFNKMPNLHLKIIGEGPEYLSLKEAANDNIEFLGFTGNEQLRKEFQKSKALILAANEDFGITSLEAQACGIPVLALRKGGYLETVKEGKTGFFFDKQDVESIVEGVRKFEKDRHTLEPESARENALRFSRKRFREEFKSFVESALNNS